MGYHINLEDISIDQYKEILKSADLIPSWMILKQNIDKNLDIVKKHNINNLEELKARIKDKIKVQKFSKESGLPEDYIAVLRRVINGFHPKPNRIRDFPSISEDIIKKLEASGFKNTFHLYTEILTAEKRNQLSKKTEIDYNVIMNLAKLTDLSRIRWVNHTFAYVLLEAGFDTTEKVANADYTKMYEMIKQLNKEKEIYKGNIGANDMKLVVEGAKMLDFDIEY